MIIIAGPPGSGKSVQGQMLAAKKGWHWLSAGQILRDSKNRSLLRIMKSGRLIDSKLMNRIIARAIKRASAAKHLVVDGYPRQVGQARWLLRSLSKLNRTISAVVVLDVPEDEIIKRLDLRGRMDDAPEVVKTRIKKYQSKTKPVLNFFERSGVNVVTIDGTGTVDQVHERVEGIIKKCVQE